MRVRYLKETQHRVAVAVVYLPVLLFHKRSCPLAKFLQNIALFLLLFQIFEREKNVRFGEVVHGVAHRTIVFSKLSNVVNGHPE